MIEGLRGAILTYSTAVLELGPLERSDREGALQVWLEGCGVAEAWELAPALVGVGWDAEKLKKLSEPFSEQQFPLLVRWLAAGSATYTLLDEMAKSAAHISEVVKAVKSYAYLDQAPVQEVDVHEGLENTLVILRHKFRQGIRIRRDYAPNLPRVETYASDLNQVWTNLIDNALDAMGDQGELGLRTYGDQDHVVVEVSDTGPGMPPEVQARIFEPFFTTKPPGVGTGLGLHIVYNSIVERHQGQIEVVSQPGHTCFRITLPVALESR
jgi:signal transduction histidine kinase